MTDPVVGVDLGGWSSAVAICGPGGAARPLADDRGRSTFPSVVAFDASGKVLVGDDAMERRLQDLENTVVLDKRSVDPAPVETRAGTTSTTDLQAILLDSLRRVATAALGEPVRRVVLTAPAAFVDVQRRSLTAAAAQAGLTVERLLSDAEAVVYAYGLVAPGSRRAAVFDFGGCKCECTILEIARDGGRVLGTAGDLWLGGVDLDARLVDILAGAFARIYEIDFRADPTALVRVSHTVARAKRLLSAQSEVQIHVPGLASVGGRSVDLRMPLTRKMLADAAGPLLDRAERLVRDATSAAGLLPSEVPDVLLAGGLSRLSPVRERIEAAFGRAARIDVDPDHAVALGAARYAAREIREDSVMRRITAPLGAGGAAGGSPPVAARRTTRVGRVVTRRMFAQELVDAAEPGSADVSFSGARPAEVEVLASPLALSTVGGYCEEIVARNRPVPLEVTRVFATGRDNQPSVNLQLCQGDSRRFHENQPLGTLVLDGLPPRPRGDVKIEVTFAIDAAGTLEASARDQATGRARTVRIRLGSEGA